MTITEPMTMITDYVLAIVSVVAARQLFVGSRRGEHALWFWAAALAFTGIAAAAGGTFHGFRAAMPELGAVVCWRTTMIAIGLATYCFAGAVILSVFSSRARTLFMGILNITLVCYLSVVWFNDSFRYAIDYYVPTMALVLVTMAFLWLRRRKPGSLWIIQGVVVSFLGALVQIGGRGFNTHFNHNDIYHVIQMYGIYCFYRGGPFFRARTARPANGAREEGGGGEDGGKGHGGPKSG